MIGRGSGWAIAIVAGMWMLSVGVSRALQPRQPAMGITDPTMAATPDLNAILTMARDRLARYTALLPNIIGMERGNSRVYHGDKLRREVSFTAHVRMIHAPLPTAPYRVTEELDFMTENGKPVRQRPKNIPFYVVDIFTNQDPQILPLPQHCFAYSLLPSAPGTIVIERWIHPLQPSDAPFCRKYNLGEKMRITLDAKTLQMIAIERPVQPRKDMKEGWEIGFTYTYTPQKLGEETELLPKRIRAELVLPGKRIRQVFEATYSDYQRYGSTATLRLPNAQ